MAPGLTNWTILTNLRPNLTAVHGGGATANQCFLDAMQQSTDSTNPGICTTNEEAMADNTDSSETSACACDRYFPLFYDFFELQLEVL